MQQVTDNVYDYRKKFQTVMVNNSSNINKTNNPLLSPLKLILDLLIPTTSWFLKDPIGH